MNKSVSIHSKQRVKSNPATSKVTTEAEDAAEVFSNNEVAFFVHSLSHSRSWYKRGRGHVLLLLHIPAKATTASLVPL